MDSDIYKTLEAIGWELAHGPHPENPKDPKDPKNPENPEEPEHPELGSFAARITGLLEEAQRPDGYLNSYFQVSGEPRYTRLAWSHEMYCAGHLIQAAVALRRGAGDGRLLAVAVRLADHLVREFAGHQRHRAGPTRTGAWTRCAAAWRSSAGPSSTALSRPTSPAARA